MGRHVYGYTEARIDGKWYCIDFYQHDMEGNLHHIPCIEGQSMVYSALDWDCDVQRISPPDDLSELVRSACTGKDRKLFGDGDTYWFPWHMVRGRWFTSVDLDQPEFCGFFPRQIVADYLSNPEDNEIDEDNMLSPGAYHALPEEERKAYQYYEYTPTWGNRAILRRFKQAVLDRISVWNDQIAWHSRNQKISLSDVRVLLIMD